MQPGVDSYLSTDKEEPMTGMVVNRIVGEVERYVTICNIYIFFFFLQTLSGCLRQNQIQQVLVLK